MTHKHDHSHHHLQGCKLLLSIILNVFITVAQAIGGVIAGSLSLLTDALHNFSDVISLIISFIAHKLTRRQCTPEQTFGYKRAEIIAAFVNSATLLVVAVLIAREAIFRLAEPAEIGSEMVIMLALLSIAVNGGSVLLLKKDSQKNLNIKSAYLHLFTDMMTSMAVLLGGIAMYFYRVFWVDSVLSIILSIYLLYSSWGLVMQTLRVLMQFAPPDLEIEKIKETILENSNIKNVHHLHLWQLNENEYHIEAHLEFNEDTSLSITTEIIDMLNKKLENKYNICHTVFQPEFASNHAEELIVKE